MILRALDIAGAFVVEPRLFPDERGVFLEAFRIDHLERATGRRFDVRQANVSVSRRGVVRGIHLASVPPGQAKYVMCLQGQILDYIVDLREGSPSFGAWQTVRLDDVERHALYLEEGLGHLFVALSEQAVVSYLVTEVFNPQAEFGVNPLDPEIGLRFPPELGEPILSEKDASAPSLAEVRGAGLLPTWNAVRAQVADHPSTTTLEM